MAVTVECVIHAIWTSNHQAEQHAVFVAPNGKGGYELIPFEGGSKLLKGAAQVSDYHATVLNGVEQETWELAFNGNDVQGFVLKMEDLAGARDDRALVQRVRQLSMQTIQMRSAMDRSVILGPLPMYPLGRITNEQILHLVKRLERHSSATETVLRNAA